MQRSDNRGRGMPAHPYQEPRISAFPSTGVRPPVSLSSERQACVPDGQVAYDRWGISPVLRLILGARRLDTSLSLPPFARAPEKIIDVPHPPATLPGAFLAHHRLPIA